MAIEKKPPVSLSFLPVGVILLLLSAGLLAAFVPIVGCPGPSHAGFRLYDGTCPRCGKERGSPQKITLLRSWFWRPTPEERAEFEMEKSGDPLK
jgi:hypothetical protein